MDLTVELYFVSGVAALGLGAAVVAGDARRARSRALALLCGAIATWCLAVAVRRMPGGEALAPFHLGLLGGCAIAALAYHCTLIVDRRARASRGRLAAGYASAALLFALSFTQLRDARGAWTAVCVAVLGTLLCAAFVALVRIARRAPGRSSPWLLRMLVAVAGVAVVLGLLDLLPGRDARPRFAPVAVLLMLFVLCLVVIRSSFLDVSRSVARWVALFMAAALATFVLQGAVALVGADPLVYFLVALLVLAVAGPLTRRLSTGTRALIDPGRDRLLAALAATSHALRSAPSREDVAAVLDRPDPTSDLRLVLDLAADEAEGPLGGRGLEIVAPLRRDGRPAGWIGLAGDDARGLGSDEVAAALLAVGYQATATLERLEAEDFARRRAELAAVGEMAAGLAHEVRNPVGAIRGAAQVLADAADPAQAREMLDVIVEETGRLGRVVGELLEYARPGEATREAVPLDDLVRRVARDAEAAGWGLRTEIDAGPGTPPAAGSRDQLQRALANLVRNAREAAGPDGTLRVEIRGDGADRVMLRLSDDGSGIAPAVLERLFEPFRSTKRDGTGLGLALVHRVVTDHGGEIHVASREGAGATFTLVLPAWRHDRGGG